MKIAEDAEGDCEEVRSAAEDAIEGEGAGRRRGRGQVKSKGKRETARGRYRKGRKRYGKRI